MSNTLIQSYISNLPISPLPAALRTQDDVAVNSIDIENLPALVVSGSNLVQFSNNSGPELRASIALSLLAAQRVASEDPATITPEQWLDRHNTVLTNLGWSTQAARLVNFESKKIDEAVSQAIVPFLSAAFSGSADNGSLILTALNQLAEANKKSSWFAVFDRESQRFQVTEYQFSVVTVDEDQVDLKVASARFEATFGRTQVLFIRVTKQHASFSGASQALTGKAAEVAAVRESLKIKLAGFARVFIYALSI